MTMKLIGDLKKKVEDSASREEKKAAIEQAGMELTDDELDKVAGGSDVVKIKDNELNYLMSLSQDYNYWSAWMGCPECSKRHKASSLRKVIISPLHRRGYIGYICERNNQHIFLE
jgi:hypothetical protein